MKKYEVITTITESPFANHTTALLEDAGIPIVVEHVDLGLAGIPMKGFRFLVPREFHRSAQRVINAAVVTPELIN